MGKHQDFKCLIGLHKREVYKEEDVTNIRGEKIGKIIITRCSNCGKLKTTYIETLKQY